MLKICSVKALLTGIANVVYMIFNYGNLLNGNNLKTDYKPGNMHLKLNGISIKYMIKI